MRNQDELARWYATQQQREQEFAAQREALARTNYNAGFKALQEAYQRRLQAMEAGHNQKLNELQRSHQQSAQQAQQQAAGALQQAYLAMMQQKRTLGQQLSAQGFTGGLQEQASANVIGGYARERGETEAQRLQTLGQLASGLQQQQAGVRQQYTDQLAQQESERHRSEIEMLQTLNDQLAKIKNEQHNNLGSLESSYLQSLLALQAVAQAQNTQGGAGAASLGAAPSGASRPKNEMKIKPPPRKGKPSSRKPSGSLSTGSAKRPGGMLMKK